MGMSQAFSRPRTCRFRQLHAAEPTEALADDEEADIAEGDGGDDTAQGGDGGGGVFSDVHAAVGNGDGVAFAEGERGHAEGGDDGGFHFLVHVCFPCVCLFLFLSSFVLIIDRALASRFINAP